MSEPELCDLKCVPCRGGIPPLKGKELEELQNKLGNEWNVIEEHHLKKRYEFPNFLDALAFTNQLGALAEEEGHHPNIHLTWGLVEVEIWTHKINGLSESDFILAAKIDAL